MSKAATLAHLLREMTKGSHLTRGLSDMIGEFVFENLEELLYILDSYDEAVDLAHFTCHEDD